MGRYARGVGQKGLDSDGEMDWVISDLGKELKSREYHGGEQGHLIFKSDDEASIRLIRDRLARHHGGKVVLENPAQGESQSNGTVEEAGKTVRECVRVFKDHLESKIRTKVNGKDPIMLWAIRWAAMVTSRYLVGKDGRTPQERKKDEGAKIPPHHLEIWYVISQLKSIRTETTLMRSGRKDSG